MYVNISTWSSLSFALLAFTVAPVRENSLSDDTLVETADSHFRLNHANTGKSLQWVFHQRSGSRTLVSWHKAKYFSNSFSLDFWVSPSALSSFFLPPVNNLLKIAFLPDGWVSSGVLSFLSKKIICWTRPVLVFHNINPNPNPNPMCSLRSLAVRLS